MASHWSPWRRIKNYYTIYNNLNKNSFLSIISIAPLSLLLVFVLVLRIQSLLEKEEMKVMQHICSLFWEKTPPLLPMILRESLVLLELIVRTRGLNSFYYKVMAKTKLSYSRLGGGNWPECLLMVEL